MIDDATAAALFERYPALSGLPGPAREALLAGASSTRVPAGAALFEERQPCRGFPMLLEGRVRVSKASPQGRELQLYRVDPGESCILTSSCLLGQAPYSARGVAETAVKLVLLPVPLFERLLAGHAPFRSHVFGLFSERLAEPMQLVEEVAFRKLDQRLAAMLLARGRVVRATHQELADELGSVREMVSRLLKSFAERGLVALGREQIEILDEPALAQAAGAPRAR